MCRKSKNHYYSAKQRLAAKYERRGAKIHGGLISLVFVVSLALTNTANADLIAWWRFDEGSGIIAADSSGNGHDGNLNGNPTWVAGKLGGALQFDGTDDHVMCGLIDIDTAVTGGMTVCAWINKPAGGDMKFCSNRQAAEAAGGGFTCTIYNDRLEMDFENSTSRNLNRDSDGPIVPADTWVHVAWVYDDVANTFDEYHDGVLADSSTENVSVGVSTVAFRIGANSPSLDHYFNGLIDDLRIYDNALSQLEIQHAMLGLGPILTIASNPNPADKEVDVPRDMVLSWTPGGYADKHNVYFGTVLDDVNEADTTDPRDVLVGPNQAASTYKPATPLEFGQTYYWRVDEVNAPPTDSTVYKGDVWSFTVEPFTYPLSGANITATASSSTPTMGPEKTIDESGLTPDPVGGGDQHSTVPTDMWLSGTTEPIWIKYEFNTEYKLHEMWVWNSNQSIEPSFGFGLRNVTIEYSTDDNNWTQLDNVPEFRQGTGLDDYTYNTTVNFNGVGAKYVRITAHGNWGGILPQCSLSEVRLFYIPVLARMPQPASEATNVALDTVLSWRAGREAALHELYFSSDMQAVIDGTALVDTIGQNSYDLSPLGLELGKTYYWKVNEVNEARIPAVWQGEVWSFTAQEYLVVEDFESYDDTCNRIFYAWVDGFGHSGDPDCGVAPYSGNVTGSTVGNLEAPFAERSIIHEGRQSMPFEYNNADAPYFSETQHQWDSPQDWTTGGANSLTLHFQGSPPPFIESPAGVIIMGAAGTDIWDAADEFRFAWKNLNGNGSIIARVESIVDTDAWAKAGVMIRNTLSPGSKFAAVYLTGDNGVRFHSRAQTNQDATSDTSVATSAQTALREPVWIKLERSGDDFYGYYATDEAGTAWTPMVWNPQTIDMLDNVYIGLVVTSHSADVLTAAKFSNVSMTGTITGQWQVEEIGVTQPGGNEADLLYVILRDSADKTAVVMHSDAEAVLMPAWMEWNIPLAEFTGVNPPWRINLQAIKEMYIGVGNKSAPQPSGAGKLFIDDIRLY